MGQSADHHWRRYLARGQWLLPSFPEWFFAALLLAGFTRAASWQALLYDGDTGWHIRTGTLILQSGTVPQTDPFSFSRPGAPWFAWEWLADVFFAALARADGLRGVAAGAAVVLCAAGAILLAWLLRRGVGLWIGLAVTLAAVSASTVHYLARPHIFSLLLFTISLWLLDEDLRRPRRIVWYLVPMGALWANLHGGFVALLCSLALLTTIQAWKRHGVRLRRYGLLLFACAAATLLNPYGWRLHAHILGYLRSSWILENVLEFHSPSIRSEAMVVFAVLLLAGAGCASRALARRHLFEGWLVLLWGFAALRSARHVPLFAIAAAPVLASECALLWSAHAGRIPRGLGRALWDAGQELSRHRYASLGGLLLAVLAVGLTLPSQPVADFPAFRFPVAAVAHNLELLAPPGKMPRLLTSDTWGSYLIFRLYPQQRVFFDGRSDFYGAEVGSRYAGLLEAAPRWQESFERYDFQLALLPVEWALASILERDARWEETYHDDVARLFVRRPASVKERDPNAECTSVDTDCAKSPLR